MKVFDLHCDTIGGVKWGYFKGIHTGEGPRHLTVEGLAQGGSYVQCFGLFASKGSSNYEFNYLKDFITLAHRLIAASPELHFVSGMSQLREDKVNAMITIEDSGCMGGKPENVQLVYDLGVRMFGIIHNKENFYGFPNSDDKETMEKGLTNAGRTFVEQLGQLGAVVDVSHLNYGGFWDVADICKGPFVASHSCADGLHHHRRNLTDEMIRTIADHGGVIGINFSSEFATGNKELMRLDDIVAQAKYMKNVGGIDCLALGSDFDGVPNRFEFQDAAGLQQIPHALLQAGFTEEEAEKIAYRNAMRVFTQVCG